MGSVVVVGGGIAGLVAARELAVAGASVSLLEGASRFGGKLATEPLAGLPVDTGADAFLVRVPDAAQLVTEVGAELVHPVTTSASVWARGRLRPLPTSTVMGVPDGVLPLLRGGVLGPVAVARAGLDLVLPRTRWRSDPAVGELVERRLGAGVVDALVDPLLGGVYAGSARELSLRACVPQLLPALEQRSLIGAVRRIRAGAPASSGPVFGGVRGGMSALVDALVADLEARAAVLRSGAVVRELHRSGAGWQVLHGPTVAPETTTADAVVLALPGRAAARLLSGAGLPGPDVDYASVAVIGFALDPADVPRSLAGSGFLVPAGQGAVKGVTWSSRKWAALASPDAFVFRCSVGRHGDERVLQRPDDELAGLAFAEVAARAGLRGRPVEWRVTRWGGGLPQYRPGHLDRVAHLRAELAASAPGLALCGAAYDGVGVPACVASGRRAARAVLAGLG